jgi:ATP-dependent Clp protease ATP-binding subunit ClpB
MQAPWDIPGSRSLCRTFVNRDFNRAQQYVRFISATVTDVERLNVNVCRLLEISPTLINTRHPLGWAPLHAVILSGDPSLVKFVLDLPGIDLTIKDGSTFNPTSPAADILCRQQELCPNICGTESTSGATALHFACMRGDMEILNLVLEMSMSHDVKDDSKRLPSEYFDLERVTPATVKAYLAASKVWCTRWRSLEKKGKECLYLLDPHIISSVLRRYDSILWCHTRGRL